MSDLPYTEADLRAEAARQHHELTRDPDYMGVGERMQDTEIESLLPPQEADGVEGPRWDGLLDEDQFDEAQRKIHDLIGGAVDVSEWAINIGAEGLEPSDVHLSVDGDDAPLVRMHFAFAKDTPAAARAEFIAALATSLADHL